MVEVAVMVFAVEMLVLPCDLMQICSVITLWVLSLLLEIILK